jgi:hypothetical protein
LLVDTLKISQDRVLINSDRTWSMVKNGLLDKLSVDGVSVQIPL